MSNNFSSKIVQYHKNNHKSVRHNNFLTSENSGTPKLILEYDQECPPSTYSLSSSADTPDLDGVFELDWTNSIRANNYSIYSYDSYISTINGSLMLLANQNATSPYSISGLLNGTYYYIAVAYNDFGNTSSNCIFIIVAIPPGIPPIAFSLSSNADTPDIDGIFILSWTPSTGANNYSIYRYHSYISQVNESLTLLANQNATSPYSISGVLNGNYYYIAIAYNDFGNTSSDCIFIIVAIPPEDTGLNDSTIWDYTGTSFYVGSQDIFPEGISWDGINWWMIGSDSDNVHKYNSDWSYTGISYDISAQCTVATGIFWDGTNWWTIEDGVFDTVYKYYSNWSYTGVSHYIGGSPKGICWDGTNWWVIRFSPSEVLQYNSDWSYTGISYDLSAQDTYPSDLFWDGVNWWVTGIYSDMVHKYNSDWSYTGLSYDTSGQDDSPTDLFWDGINWWMLGYGNSRVYAYEDGEPPIISCNANNPDTDGSFTLTWTPSIVNNYSIYSHDDYFTQINSNLTILANQSAASPYPISGLLNGTYYYIVVAYNSFGNTSLSNCISVTVAIPPGTPPETPPSEFSLSSDSNTPDPDGTFVLNWTDSTGANNYSIYTHDGYITQINSSLTFLANQNTTSPYSISLLLNGMYYYIVVAYNSFGNTSSNCISVTVEISSDFLPSAFILSSNAENPDTDGSFTLIWEESLRADFYLIYVSDQFISEIGINTTFIFQTSLSTYIIEELETGEYYYIVTAQNQYGNTLSNCIKVYVQFSGEAGIPGYNLFMILFLVAITSVYVIKKRRK